MLIFIVKQFKQELYFFKNCQLDEVLIIKKHTEQNYSEIISFAKSLIQNFANGYNRHIMAEKSEVDRTHEIKMDQLRRQLQLKIDEQSERSECTHFFTYLTLNL